MELQHLSRLYLQLLDQVTEFRAIPLSKLLKPFALQSGSGGYGLVSKVSADGYSAGKAMRKTIFLLDPTTCNKSIEFSVRDHSGIIVPGDILKLTEIFASNSDPQNIVLYGNRHIRHNPPASGSRRFELFNSSMLRFETFSVDYNQAYKDPIREELSMIFSEIDLKIFFLLETFIATRILHSQDLTRATSLFASSQEVYRQKLNGNTVGYIDLVGMVIKRTVLDRSVAITIFDGSPCMLPSTDPVKLESAIKTGWANHSLFSSTESTGETESNQIYSEYLANYHITVNVWNNDRPPDSPQYVTASQLNIFSNEIIVCLNVEKEICVTPPAGSETLDPQAVPCASLTLRSGQHQGKALRKATAGSVIGRLFYRMVKEKGCDLFYSIVKEQSDVQTNFPEMPCLRLQHGEPEICLRSDFSITLATSTFPSPLASRITFPLVHQPSDSLRNLLTVYLPSFISFSSLVSISEIRLSIYSQLLNNHIPAPVDLIMYGSQFNPQRLQDIFSLARVFHILRELNVENV